MIKDWWRKLSAWRRRETLDAELQEEIESHIAIRAADTGNSAAARKQFGNAPLLLEDSRGAWTWPRPEAWLCDLRYGLRRMHLRPAFAATVIGTLALGMAPR